MSPHETIAENFYRLIDRLYRRVCVSARAHVLCGARLDGAMDYACANEAGRQNWSSIMIVWTPIAVDEKPYLRGQGHIPPYSATVIGTSVVLRMYGGGVTSLPFALTTIPFPSASDAVAWIEAHRSDKQNTAQKSN
jgi:hypothetical protein